MNPIPRRCVDRLLVPRLSSMEKEAYCSTGLMIYLLMLPGVSAVTVTTNDSTPLAGETFLLSCDDSDTSQRIWYKDAVTNPIVASSCSITDPLGGVVEDAYCDVCGTPPGTCTLLVYAERTNSSSGEWICSVNGVTNSTSVDVIVPPAVENQTSSTTVQLNTDGSGTLSCMSACGYPQSIITWNITGTVGSETSSCTNGMDLYYTVSSITFEANVVKNNDVVMCCASNDYGLQCEFFTVTLEAPPAGGLSTTAIVLIAVGCAVILIIIIGGIIYKFVIKKEKKSEPETSESTNNVTKSNTCEDQPPADY